MKICWDNLERVSFSKKRNFIIHGSVYIEMEKCKECGDSYLTQKIKPGLFCSRTCFYTNKHCGMYGKTHTDEFKKKRSEEMIGKNNPFFGKTHTVETKRKMAKKASRRVGKLNSNYRGGVATLGFTVYTTYKDRLLLYEDVRKKKGTKFLEVTCAYCGQWYSPKRSDVIERLKAANSLNRGEQRLYCSDNCKHSCPTYGMHKYPKGFKQATSREVNPYLRQMVLKRDNWECQKCGNTIEDAPLHVHHMDPVAQNPVFQNDMNSCITLCKECHEEVHKQYGCRYVDLKCKKEE